MNKPLRKVLIVLGACLAIFAAILLCIGWIVRLPFPQTRGTLSAKGLEAEVEILRDGFGVPHIRSRTMHDLYFAQGYVAAQDRFWQMDFWRRIGAGRLSEVFGKATLGTDRYLRTMGFRRIAEQEYPGHGPRDKKRVRRLCRGSECVYRRQTLREAGAGVHTPQAPGCAAEDRAVGARGFPHVAEAHGAGPQHEHAARAVYDRSHPTDRPGSNPGFLRHVPLR